MQNLNDSPRILTFKQFCCNASYLKIISSIFSESLQWIKLKTAATLVNDKLKNSSS